VTESLGEGVALPAAQVRLGYRLAALAAIGRDAYLPTPGGQQITLQNGAQLHVRAGVGAQDIRHGTGGTQTGFPRQVVGFQKAAFFAFAPAVIVAVKVFAFSSIGSSHGEHYSTAARAPEGRKKR
jgi:hypothetical protein